MQVRELDKCDSEGDGIQKQIAQEQHRKEVWEKKKYESKRLKDQLNSID